MSITSAATEPVSPNPARSAADANRTASEAGRRARRRRMYLLWSARLAFAVIVIGGWQLFTALKIVDPFFYGQPSGIW
jgi:NitT/TauT family transport system permease protein